MYVNYAMVEDFKKLRDMNITVSGHIVIAKYGKIYRGDKVSRSKAYGNGQSSHALIGREPLSITVQRFLRLCAIARSAGLVPFNPTFVRFS